MIEKITTAINLISSIICLVAAIITYKVNRK